MAEAKKAPKKKQLKETEAVAETTPAEEPVTTEKIVVAKAGKRSAKALKESEIKEAKTAHKLEKVEVKPVNPPRSRLERAGKKYREAAKLVDSTKEYAPAEAVELAAKTSPVKFDATVELHVRLNVDPKQADQNIRGTVVLPAGSGKQAKVAVFADGAEAEAAKKAGADIVGGDDFLARLEKNQTDFDTLVTTPAMMSRLGKYAKLLGPKGLMPNPKSGTVTADIAKAVTEAKAGKIEYRVDQAGIIHLGVGKVSQGQDNLFKNVEAVIAAIRSARPGSVKGIYIRSAYLTTTMGPSIKLSM